jgi:hypothetical protein
MRLKLKYALPVVQMLAAVVLLVWTDRWERALMRIQDMPGTPPSFTLLIAINAPLAIPRAMVFHYLPGLWDDITLVVLFGAFWYWVALNIETWQQRRRVFMFSWLPLRLLGDLTAVATGIVWSLILWHDFILWREYDLPRYPQTGWLWLLPCEGLPILWSLALILLFGRDFIHCVFTIKRTPGSENLKLT